MRTNTELQILGFKALVDALGPVDAERFIALTICEPFDYTEWQRNLWPEESISTLSQAAIQVRRERQAAESELNNDRPVSP